MKGIAAIIHDNGWAVTNEAVFDADKHLVDVDGKKYSRDVLTIKVFSIFDCEGKVTDDQHVECIFKSEEGKKYAFIGDIKSRGKNLTVIHNLFKSERYTEILNKIKQ